MEFSNGTTSITAGIASNGTASNAAAAQEKCGPVKGNPPSNARCTPGRMSTTR